MLGPSISRINNFFSPPSKCPTNLFGPVSNRAILKQLHVTSRSSSRNPRRRSATPRLESKNLLAPRLQSPIFPDQSPISNQPPAGTPNLQCPMPVLGYARVASVLRPLASRNPHVCCFQNTRLGASFRESNRILEAASERLASTRARQRGIGQSYTARLRRARCVQLYGYLPDLSHNEAVARTGRWNTSRALLPEAKLGKAFKTPRADGKRKK